jgi:sulfonate transport system permease protein
MGVSRLIRAALDSLLTALYTVPKLALIPVFVTLFGFGDLPRIALIAVTVFFFVWISTMSAIMGVEEGYREAALSFGASKWQIFRHVLFPGALPQIFVGLRIAAGVAVLMLIGVELVLASDGLGALIEKGRTLFLPELTYVGIALSALLGLTFTYLVRILGRVLVPWAPEDQTPNQN